MVDKSAEFERVIAHLLAPLAQAMIAHGVTLNSALRALKSALFEAAQQTAPDGAALTDSRVSLLTGLHRKDARAFRENAGSISSKRTTVNATSLAIAVWSSHAQFADDDGQPLPLSKSGFDSLVRAARIDLPAATVLDALVEGGEVEAEGDTLRLQTSTLVPSPDSQALLEVYEKNLMAHLMAATENLLAEPDDRRNFERAVHVNQLSPQSVETLEERAREMAQAMLVGLNRCALDLQDADVNAGDSDQRFSVGVYMASRQDKGVDSSDA